MSDSTVVVSKIATGKRFVSGSKVWAEVNAGHTVTDENEIIVTSTAAPRNITLPLLSGGPLGKTLSVVDGSGLAGTNNITITAAGSDTINGAATASINTNYGTLTIVPTAADGWVTEVSAGGGAPSGAAGGDLGGTYPNPTVAAIHTTTGPTKLTIGAIADGALTKRSGATLVGATAGTDFENPLTFANGLTRTTNAIANDLITGKAGGQTITLGTGAAEGGTISSTAHATLKGTVDIGALSMLHFQEDVAASGLDYVNFRIGKNGLGVRESFALSHRGSSLGDDLAIGANPAGGVQNFTSSACRLRFSLLSGSEYQIILQPGNSGATATTVFTASGLNKVCTAAGGWRFAAWNAQSADYTVLLSDFAVSMDTTGANRVATLPSAVTAGIGATFVVKRITAGANTMTVKATAGTIDGVAAATGISMPTQYQSRIFESDGANWNIVGGWL